MEWVKLFELIAAISFVGAVIQLLRFRTELKKIDKDQELTDELAKKWTKKLHWVILFGASGAVFAVISYIFRIFYTN
ncbi:hypothetical protein [Bacillus cihuensis]|uniref:hypothetical protein n=1 Tax=Bacillus cihuensis TaxID=1208599 RepID=UPI0004119282|nr:hypothetical protein [Bacillus cihuensis]